jgi:hypothetical protein
MKTDVQFLKSFDDEAFINKHSESIASNTKSPTGGIFHQSSSRRTKLNSKYLRLQSQSTKVQKTDNL